MRSICNLPMMPLRKENSHGSEMVSMLLFGEAFEVLESKEVWHRIKCSYDGYEGWIRAGKILQFDETFWKNYDGEKPVYSNTGMEDSSNLFLSPGSRLPLFNNLSFALGSDKFILEDELPAFEFENTEDAIAFYAEQFINTPYLWGGRSLMGIDCSGLTQVVFKLCDISLPRDAWQQAEKGEAVSSLSETKCGDLAFFSEAGNKITHVGILLGEAKIIHASEFVRIDTIDENGIFNTYLEKHTLKPVLIKRYF